MAAKKPCEFCEPEFIQDYITSTNADVYLEMYPGRMIAVTCYIRNPMTEEQEESGMQLPCNYCPNCGRKLE